MALPISVVSAANSTTAPLGALGTFTGAFEDVSAWTSIQILVRSDVAGVMTLRWSPDAVNLDRSVAITVDDITGVYYSSGVRARYLRIDYVNGATPQTFLRMQATYSPGTDYPGISQISETPSDRAPAWNVKAHQFAPNSSGAYQHIESGGGAESTALRVTLANDSTGVVSEPKLAFRFDSADSPILYFGEAAAGSDPADSVWRISRTDTSAPEIIDEWADGNADLDNIWDNRASLSYS